MSPFSFLVLVLAQASVTCGLGPSTNCKAAMVGIGKVDFYSYSFVLCTNATELPAAEARGIRGIRKRYEICGLCEIRVNKVLP